MSTENRIIVENDRQIIGQLKALDRKVRNKTVRKATGASGKVVLKQVQTNAASVKQTGFTRRSLKSSTKTAKGSTTVKVGQEKRKTFKARKSNRVKGKNLSQIQRAGKPVPIHWIELGTSAHVIRARPGSRLVFAIGRKTKFKSGLAFARAVRNPGSRGRKILANSGRQASRAAAAAFYSVARSDLARISDA